MRRKTAAAAGKRASRRRCHCSGQICQGIIIMEFAYHISHGIDIHVRIMQIVQCIVITRDDMQSGGKRGKSLPSDC